MSRPVCGVCCGYYAVASDTASTVMEPEVAQHVDLLDEDSTFFVEFSRIPMNKTIAAILFLWAGLSLGVASIATPAKFLAPSLPMNGCSTSAAGPSPCWR